MWTRHTNAYTHGHTHTATITSPCTSSASTMASGRRMRSGMATNASSHLRIGDGLVVEKFTAGE